jgi:hypothetical protein
MLWGGFLRVHFSMLLFAALVARYVCRHDASL